VRPANTSVSRALLSLLLLLLPCPRLPAGAYEVGPGDVLDIKVGDEPSLSGDFRVSDEGSIIYPLLGSLDVNGMDAPAIAALIRERLAKDYLVSPQVAVFVREYDSKKVALLGDIPTPGFYVLKADGSLLAMLSEAGLKLSGTDATTTITLTRSIDTRDGAKTREAPVPQVYKLEELLNPWQEQEPIVLHDGDRVFVRSGSSGKVIVSGKVSRPGVISLSDGLTVMEAINKAGGAAEFANLKTVRVVRESPTGSEVIPVDVTAIMNGDRSQDQPLRDGDIIVVPRRWF
jgi:polysaccharide biosynthesis/export protein